MKGSKDGRQTDWASPPTGRTWQSESWPVIWLDLFFRKIFLEAMLSEAWELRREEHRGEGKREAAWEKDPLRGLAVIGQCGNDPHSPEEIGLLMI